MRFRNTKTIKKILLVTKNSNAYTSHVLGTSVKLRLFVNNLYKMQDSRSPCNNSQYCSISKALDCLYGYLKLIYHENILREFLENMNETEIFSVHKFLPFSLNHDFTQNLT